MFEEEFAKLPVETPRRVENLPGLRFWGAIPKAAILLPLFFLSFFLFIPLSIMNADPAARLAMGSSESAQGRVVSNTASSACRGAASHRITYSFSSKGAQDYRGAVTLCEESPYYSVAPGDVIVVRYLKSDPAVNGLPNQGANQGPPLAVFLIFPLFFVAIFGSMFWPQIRDVLLARRLYQRGRLTNGKVIFIKKRATSFWPGMPGSNPSQVYVEIQPSGGPKRELVTSCQNDWLVNQLAPGSNVHVAYLDDASSKAALLDAYWR
jgi:hypothetical protein